MNFDEPMNVLVIDNQEESHEFIANAIADSSLKVIQAKSGDEALRLVTNPNIVAVLLDVHLPDFEGFSLADQLRKFTISSAVPFIFISSSLKDIEAVMKTYSIGVVDYLIRPFDPLLLKNKLNIYIQNFMLIQALQKQLEKSRILVTALQLSCNELKKKNISGVVDVLNEDSENQIYIKRLLDLNLKTLKKNEELNVAHMNLVKSINEKGKV